ncbi:MAG: pyroglutamyl-peptidase I [Chloroflexota bacterium]
MEVVKHFDGTDVASFPVIGRVLPVGFSGLQQRVGDILREVDPLLVLNLGLWPGEATIRLERIALNLADFEIPDNAGELVQDRPLDLQAPDAVPSRLPLRAIEGALLNAGIPVRMSNTAGGFLCNATMYTFLQWKPNVVSGFVHLPYLPEQVAALLKRAKVDHNLELHQRADYASMSLATMLEAVRIILATSVAVAPGEESWTRVAATLSHRPT